MAEQGRWLGAVVRGFFAYHAVPTNILALSAFRHHVIELWRRALLRRSQKDRTSWTDMDRLADRWLPKPRIAHPGLQCASASNTQGGSRMREFRPYGSVRGALRNGRPYRD